VTGAGPDILRRHAAPALAFAVATGLLLVPALWNGAPFYYWDSVDYVYLPFTWDLPVYRTVSYGVFAGVARFFDSPWAVIALQALLAVWFLREALAVFWPGRPERALVLLALALGAGTALPWTVGRLMPDAMTGMVVLGYAALMFDTGQLGRRRPLLAALTAVAIFVHTSHIALAAGLVIAFGGIALFGPRLRLDLRPRLGLPAAALAAAIVMVVGAHCATVGRPMLTQPTSMLMLARLVQDGIAKQFLDDNCVNGKPYRLCRFKDRLPSTANAFLWQGNSIPQQLGGWKRLSPEAAEIVSRSLSEYPWLHVAAAATLTWQQFAMFRTGDGLAPGVGWFVDDTLRRYYPDDYEDFVASRQRAGKGIDFDAVNRVDVPFQAVTLALMLLAAGWAWRRGVRPATGLLLCVVLALGGNAFICGALSNPNDRYQSRVTWLATVAVAVAVAVALDEARRRRAALPETAPARGARSTA
jgi:hypothetical protein